MQRAPRGRHSQRHDTLMVPLDFEAYADDPPEPVAGFPQRGTRNNCQQAVMRALVPRLAVVMCYVMADLRKPWPRLEFGSNEPFTVPAL